MTHEDLTIEIITYLERKHCIDIEDEYVELEAIGEDDDTKLMFELAKEFDVHDKCDGDEIGEYASIWNAVNAIYELM